MVTAAIGVTAVAFAAVVAVLVGRWARSRSDRRFEDVLSRLDEHMSAISGNLQHAVERSVEARDNGVGDLELTLDFNRLVALTVEEAVTRTGADTAAIRVHGPNNTPLGASYGGTHSSALLEATLAPPDARPFRALTIDWTYGPALEGDAETYKSALVVPIVEAGVSTGAVAAFAKAPHAFRSEQTRALRTLIDEVTPGIANARRFARAEQRTLTDELTGARNLRGYEAELEREVARARRTGRPLSLLALSLDVTSETDRHGFLGSDLALKEFAELLTHTARATDVLCRRDATEFAFLLPETNAAGARTFLLRVRQAAAAHTFTHAAPTMASAGLVDWRPNETSESLHARVVSAVTQFVADDSPPREISAAHRHGRARERLGETGSHLRRAQSRPSTRRTFLDRLAHEVARAHRDSDPLALLVLDVSGIQSLHKRLGEVAASHVLSDVTMRLGGSVPDGGMSCRTGEDELAVILPQTTASGAEHVVAALQASLRDSPPEGTEAFVVSAGITELTATDDQDSVFGRAEEALWHARQAGEGTVVVSTANGDARRH